MKNNFGTVSSIMSVNGLTCQLNMPEALTGEGIHGLPPYNPVLAYPVDDYNCPDNWMHGSSKASSYFMGVKPNSGMWLNFNNCLNHSHHVAILISIQGVNPITGLKSDKLRLEKYKIKCPIHDVEFGQDRYCKECDFKWPAQNFISSVGIPYGHLWLDGFRKPDGTVRQYIFTEEEIRSVAKAIIGDDRVFAIGVAFYLSKELKPQPKKIEHEVYTSAGIYTLGSLKSSNLGYSADNIPITYKSSIIGGSELTRGMSDKGINYFSPIHTPQHWQNATSSASASSNSTIKGVISRKGAVPNVITETQWEDLSKIANRDTEKEIATKLEIGAGANIDQQIYECPEELSFWQDEPAGWLYINYVSNTECMKIVSQGKKQHKEEGYLEGIKVGNSD